MRFLLFAQASEQGVWELPASGKSGGCSVSFIFFQPDSVRMKIVTMFPVFLSNTYAKNRICFEITALETDALVQYFS